MSTQTSPAFTAPPVATSLPQGQDLSPLLPDASIDVVCAHIAAALSLEPSARDARLEQITAVRMLGLEQAPRLDFAAGYTQLHRGPFPSSAEVEARAGLPAFRLDDSGVYRALLANFASHIDPTTSSPDAVRKSALTQVLWTIGSYFGNFEGSPQRDAARQHKYLAAESDHTFSIADFRNSGMGMCVEKAALAQNLLAFLGYDVELFGTKLEQAGKQAEGHAFNVLHTTKGHFLVDFANPIRVSLPDGSHSYIPNCHPLSNAQYGDLLIGRGVTVQVSNLIFDGTRTTSEPPATATYTSPNLSLTVARERVEAAQNRLSVGSGAA